MFFGDLYAIGFVTPAMLIESVRAVVQTCTQVDHLVCVFAILSRANSYMGPKLPHEFYADISVHIQRNCQAVEVRLQPARASGKQR